MECAYYYFVPDATSKYKIVADSENAYIGWVEVGIDDAGVVEFLEATWADEGVSFEVEATKDRPVYIARSTADFSQDTYNITITKVEE